MMHRNLNINININKNKNKNKNSIMIIICILVKCLEVLITSQVPETEYSRSSISYQRKHFVKTNLQMHFILSKDTQATLFTIHHIKKCIIFNDVLKHEVIDFNQVFHRHFGPYKQSKLRGTWRKGRSNAVKSS